MGFGRTVGWALCAVNAWEVAALADSPASRPVDREVDQRVQVALGRAVNYLRAVQNEDGSFGEGDYGPAITGLVVTGLLRTRQVTVADAMVKRALGYLEKHIQPDGGIYAPGGHGNYPTAICTMALVEANIGGRYRQQIDRAVAYLKREQWDEGEGATPDSPRFGGAGYGGKSKSRPDLSNTAFLLEALRASGLPQDDPAYRRALVFVSRCQNLSGEGANDLPHATRIEDGGFYYTPVEDYNPAGGDRVQGLRSYGSMTYAGLKSFIHAGLDKKDRRVQAAVAWIRKNYTLAENPGLGEQGLYYYYHTFAKTLTLLDLDQFEDAQGRRHDWRRDLVTTLLAKQNENGSWSNPSSRWLENDPRLVTAYVLLALANVRP